MKWFINIYQIENFFIMLTGIFTHSDWNIGKWFFLLMDHLSLSTLHICNAVFIINSCTNQFGLVHSLCHRHHPQSNYINKRNANNLPKVWRLQNFHVMAFILLMNVCPIWPICLLLTLLLNAQWPALSYTVT